MVDTSEFSEGQYLTVESVKNSPSKKCVIIGEPKGEETDYGKRLVAQIELDGKKKLWRMNRDSVRNMQQISIDSRIWNGSSVGLRIISINGKESIIGVPFQVVTEKVI